MLPFSIAFFSFFFWAFSFFSLFFEFLTSVFAVNYRNTGAAGGGATGCAWVSLRK